MVVATEKVELAATKDSSLKILGDSSLHKWEAKAGKLEITGVLSGQKSQWLKQLRTGSLNKLSVVVAVEGLKSNEGSSMDKNMRKAMGGEKFPEVRFDLKSYTVKDGDVTAQGTLTIHGVSKEVELKGQLASKDDSVSVKGSYSLLMSDYGIKPPVMMLGTVRVVDKVTIAYDYSLASSTEAAAKKD